MKTCILLLLRAALVPVLMGAYGCGTLPSSDQAAIATSQAVRAVQMATRMASNLQATATALSQQSVATAQAIQSTFSDAVHWSLIISDTFDENSNNWLTGHDSEPSLALIEWSIING